MVLLLAVVVRETGIFILAGGGKRTNVRVYGSIAWLYGGLIVGLRRE